MLARAELLNCLLRRRSNFQWQPVPLGTSNAVVANRPIHNLGLDLGLDRLTSFRSSCSCALRNGSVRYRPFPQPPKKNFLAPPKRKLVHSVLAATAAENAVHNNVEPRRIAGQFQFPGNPGERSPSEPLSHPRLGRPQAVFETGDHTTGTKARSECLVAVRPGRARPSTLPEIELSTGRRLGSTPHFREPLSGRQDFQQSCPGRHRHFGLDALRLQYAENRPSFSFRIDFER